MKGFDFTFDSKGFIKSSYCSSAHDESVSCNILICSGFFFKTLVISVGQT